MKAVKARARHFKVDEDYKGGIFSIIFSLGLIYAFPWWALFTLVATVVGVWWLCPKEDIKALFFGEKEGG